MALKNAIFRFSVSLSGSFTAVEGEKLTTVLSGQLESVTIPRLAQTEVEWNGNAKTTEIIRTFLRPMQAQYVLGGIAESLVTGVHNSTSEIVVTFYKRGERGIGADKTEKHFMTGPLQDPDYGPVRQGEINRVTYIQDCIAYRKQIPINGKLTTVRLIETTEGGKNQVWDGTKLVDVRG